MASNERTQIKNPESIIDTDTYQVFTTVVPHSAARRVECVTGLLSETLALGMSSGGPLVPETPTLPPVAGRYCSVYYLPSSAP